MRLEGEGEGEAGGRSTEQRGGVGGAASSLALEGASALHSSLPERVFEPRASQPLGIAGPGVREGLGCG